MKRGRLAAAAIAMCFLAGCLPGSAFGEAEFGIDRPLIGKTHPVIPMLFEPTSQCSGGHPFCSYMLDLTQIADAEPMSQAGAHVDGTVSFKIADGETFSGSVWPAGRIRDVVTDLPAGFIGNPEAVPACSRELFSDMAGSDGSRCSPSSQVGLATIDIQGGVLGKQTVPVYRIARPADAPAAFGFAFEAQAIVLTPELRSDGDYGIRIAARNTSSTFPVRQVSVTLWGVPMDGQAPGQGHYDDRWDLQSRSWGVGTDGPRRPFLINPPRCNSGELETRLSMNSWEQPNRWLPRDLGDPAERELYTAHAPEPTGCEFLPPFTASLDIRPADRRAATPAGYEARLAMPYNDDPDGLAFPYLKKVEVELPEGVSVSPSAAHGLVGCSDVQAGFGTKDHAACPDASKIAQVSVGTPLLPERLHGDAFIGSPTPDQLLRVFVILKGFGLTVRVAGDVHADPVTGRLRAVFDNNPQVPFTDLEMRFDTGPRASLVNPPTCGEYTTVTTMTSWNEDVKASESSFTVDRGPAGQACQRSLGFAPRLGAGTTDPLGGGFTKFGMHLERADTDQQIDRLSMSMPPGLVAKLAGVPLCSSDRADAGTCGEGSRIGRVEAASGAGPDPFWVPGPGKDATSVFLSGPYRGAPYSLSVLVPAQAGPFDLGRVVVRSPIHVDERSAQVSVDVAESRVYDRFGRLARVIPGKIPHILEGIPLLVKELRVLIDRDEFMLNPTSCGSRQVRATVGALDGRSVALDSRFRATDCSDLPFEPRLKLALTGKRQVTTGKHPGVKAQVDQQGLGEAAIRKAVVRLPKSLALDPDNAQTLCEFEDGTKPDLESHCPKGSIIGRARAKTPLLDRDLVGNVYFVKNVRVDPRTGNRIRTLPMLVVALRGEIAINLRGVSSTTRNNRLVNTFAAVPDAPITRFNMNIKGGRNGILAVTRTRRALINLCAKPRGHVAEADIDGQNGRRYDRDIRMKTPCTRRQIKQARKAAKRAAQVRRAAARRA